MSFTLRSTLRGLDGEPLGQPPPYLARASTQEVVKVTRTRWVARLNPLTRSRAPRLEPDGPFGSFGTVNPGAREDRTAVGGTPRMGPDLRLGHEGCRGAAVAGPITEDNVDVLPRCLRDVPVRKGVASDVRRVDE